MTNVTGNLNLPPDPDKPTAPVVSKVPVKKVAAAGIGGSIVVVLVAILGGINPDVFQSLGAWGPLVSAAVVALTAFLSGYIKKP